jgi:hypothetical protein
MAIKRRRRRKGSGRRRGLQAAGFHRTALSIVQDSSGSNLIELTPELFYQLLRIDELFSMPSYL